MTVSRARPDNKDRPDDQRAMPPSAAALKSTTLKFVVAFVWAVIVGGLMAGGATILGQSPEDALLMGVLGGMGAAMALAAASGRLNRQIEAKRFVRMIFPFAPPDQSNARNGSWLRRDDDAGLLRDGPMFPSCSRCNPIFLLSPIRCSMA